MTTVTESGGRQNMYPTEPVPYLDSEYEGYGPNAEKINGRLAMLGFTTGLISYIATGSFFSVSYTHLTLPTKRIV